MNKLKILLLTLCLSGLTSSLGAASTSNSIVAPSPTTISKNIKLPEFQYTLAQAQKAGYPKTVALIKAEDYDKALTQLETEFIKEPVAGYKKGFFSEALKGICLEKSGQIVEAYRAYQNARYYCDEEKTLGNPAPKLEIYIGIGRMCNQAGRYYDALNYLDAARMEAAEYPSVAIAADRSLIFNAHENGDYEFELELFEDIKRINISEKRDKLDPYNLSQEEYEQYSTTFFKLNEDRKGFSVLLEGLNVFGIDDDSGVNDLLLRRFIYNLSRANDNETKRFYELLGFEIGENRSLKGDEKHLAFLFAIRKILCENYDFLDKQDDQSNIINRVKEVKLELINKASNEDLISSKLKRMKRSKISPKNHNPKLQNDSSIDENKLLEDKLMTADWNIQSGNKNYAINLYNSMLNIETGKIDKIIYDGTYMINRIYYKLALSKIKNIPKSNEYAMKMFDDGSKNYILSIILRQILSDNLDMNGIIEACNDRNIFLTHPLSLWGLEKMVKKSIKMGENKIAIEYIDFYSKICNLNQTLAVAKVTAYNDMCLHKLAAKCTFDLIKKGNNLQRNFESILTWLSDEDLLEFDKVVAPFWIRDFFRHYDKSNNAIEFYVEDKSRLEDCIKTELELRECYHDSKFKEVIKGLYSKWRLNKYSRIEVKTLLAMGKTNEAINTEILELKNHSSKTYPNDHTIFIESYMDEIPENIKSNYYNLVKKIKPKEKE